MSAEDYMPDDLGWGDEDYRDASAAPFSCARRSVPTCKRCGAFCRWGSIAGGWRLTTFKGHPHVCADKIPTPDDFEAAA